MARKDMLPVQAWDEINVTNDRVKTPQKTEVIMKMPKGMEKALKEFTKAQKGRKKNGR